MKSYRRDLVAAGIGLTTASFVFLFPYIGSIVNRHFTNVTSGPINVTVLDPRNLVNLFVFAVLFFVFPVRMIQTITILVIAIAKLDWILAIEL